jgi:hypothetical protein
MHGAWYVSDEHARQFGMIGRSWGCPAIPLQDAQPVIDAIKGGSFVFAYSAAASPSVQRASYHPSSAKSHRVVAASNRSRHSARQGRTRGKVVVASFHSRSSSRAAGRSTARSLATRTAR